MGFWGSGTIPTNNFSNFWDSQPTNTGSSANDFWSSGSAESNVSDFWDRGTSHEDVSDFWSPSISYIEIYDSVSSSGTCRSADPLLSKYHFLDNLFPGKEYTIEVHRLENDFDPAMWIFANHHTFQDFLNSGTLSDGRDFNFSTIDFLDFADDEIAHPGPWGDPWAVITVPYSGELTVVVTNFLSGQNDGGDGRFDYLLKVIGEFADQDFSSFENANGDIILVGVPNDFWTQDDVAAG